jgi:transcriptional regulator with XRE-family HTH domain
MTLDFNIIGLRVKESRLQKQMSQAVLAERIDMSVTYISHIETAKKQASLETLVRIADVLGVTMDVFLYGNQANNLAEYQTELLQLLEDCTSYEKRIIYEIAFAAKMSVRNNKRLQNKDEKI